MKAPLIRLALKELVALQPLYPSNLERRALDLREMGRAEEAEEDERQANQLREAGF